MEITFSKVVTIRNENDSTELIRIYWVGPTNIIMIKNEITKNIFMLLSLLIPF